MRVLVKVGGAQLSDQESRDELAHSVQSARADGHEIIVVHGGGDQIRDLTGRLGIPANYHDGLRVTDALTADAVLMVLGGSVNRWLVSSLAAASCPAVGLTGADGSIFQAAPLTSKVDLGFVGRVTLPNKSLIETLLSAGVTPVVATVAPLATGLAGDRSRFYNINADHGAGPLASAFGAEAVLFLTNVPGVLGRDKTRIPTLGPKACAALREEGVLRDGMIPKVEAALLALAAHPTGHVVIAPAHGPDAVRQALSAETGTVFRPDAGPADRAN